MKLKTVVQSGVHTDMVTACSWDANNELFTVSDDKTIHKWSLEGDSNGTVCNLESFVTGLAWCPSIGKQRADTFAVSCSDGTFRIMSSNGREEKRIEAHKSCAVISVSWSHDASAIVTSGEDGTVKVWSRVGMLRNTIKGNGHPVYCALWGPDDEQILFTGGRQIMVKSIQHKDRKQLQWNAHDKSVLDVDWNAVTGLIVSGGEDCKYRVWDAYGRPLFQSQPFDQVVTSVQWSPNGEFFAVGSFNMLRLCDKNGWSYCRKEVNTGSVLSVSWTADSTMIAGAGANGSVVLGQIVERSTDWKHVNVFLSDVDQLQVTESLSSDDSDFAEALSFRDRVLEFDVAHDHIVVACATQIHLYALGNLSTPHIVDLPKGTSINMLVLSAKYFCTADNVRGLTVYTYEGRRVSNPVFPGLRVEMLDRKTVSLSSDAIAILDRAGGDKVVRLLDPSSSSGRALGTGKLTHDLEICEVQLSQMQDSFTRFLAYTDKNRDLYLAVVASDARDPRRPCKLHTMVDSIRWNDTSDMLVALADSTMVTWNYPQALWVDSDLVPQSRSERDAPEFGKLPTIKSFYGNQVVIRHADGATMNAAVPPYARMLHDFVRTSSTKWEEAVRLCRLVDSRQLWATLAAMAIQGRHLDTAEIALAAIDAVDKLHHMLYIKEIPSEKGKMAELALYRGDPAGAEQVLLHANPPLLYRAIKMNIRLCRWERALELATSKNKHVDTVLWYRAKYLEAHGLQETIPALRKMAEKVTIDEETVKANKAREKDEEARRYGGGSNHEEEDEDQTDQGRTYGRRGSRGDGEEDDDQAGEGDVIGDDDDDDETGHK